MSATNKTPPVASGGPFTDGNPNVDWFRITRLTKHIPQKKIADSLNMNPSYLSLLENGKRAMSFEVAVRYARLLGYKVDVSIDRL